MTTPSARPNWWLTVRDGLPRIVELMGKLQPTFELTSVAAIDDVFVRQHDVGGIIWDVDGTLMPHHGTALAPEVSGQVSALFAMATLRHVIVSNCGEHRFEELGRIFPQHPVLRAYAGPQPRAFTYRRLLRGRDSWTPDPLDPAQVAAARQVRKPSAELIAFARKELGDLEPERVLVVGDQYFTDVASANLGGVRSVRVPTLARETFPLAVRLLQRAEQLLVRFVH